MKSFGLFFGVAVMAALVVLAPCARAEKIAVNDYKIDIVDGTVTPGPVRTGFGAFVNAYDDDPTTRTFTTPSGTTTAPQHTLLDFEDEGHWLSRTRISNQANNDGNGRMTQITLRYTTDTDPDLNARTYSDVQNMAVVVVDGSDDAMPNVSVVGNTIEHLDLLHEGFYSVIFDPVVGATGIEYEWNNEFGFKHWTVWELEAYAIPEPSTIVYAIVGLMMMFVCWRRRSLR